MGSRILRLSQIIGQKPAVRILKSALPPGQPGSAYLFAGPSGVGKMTTAMAWARSFFCQELSSTGDSCGRCVPCQKTDGGTNPDFIVVSPEVKDKKVKEEISIDSIRKIIERLGYKPYEADLKITIIENADRMNINAANAFLKTLEEPSGDTIIILTASNPGQLPATILSRCQTLRFTPAPTEDVVDYLIQTKGMDEDVAKTVAVMSRGSMGNADPEKLKDSIELRSVALDFIAGARNGPVAKYFRIARNMDKSKDRESVDRLLVMVLSLLREIAIMKITGKYDNVLNIDILEDLNKAGRGYSPRRILEISLVVESLIAARSLHINPFLTFCLLFSEARKDI